jgi:hypothetical protein
MRQHPPAHRQDQPRVGRSDRGRHFVLVEVYRITGDPHQLSEAISYMTSDARPAKERQHGDLGTSQLIDPDAGAAIFESFGRRTLHSCTART